MQKLKHVMEEFRNKLPAVDGLVIRSTFKERVRAEKYTQKISTLPAYKPRGRKKADSAYRNRVGKHAHTHTHTHTRTHTHTNTHRKMG